MTRPTNLIHTLLTVLTVVGVSLFGQTAQAQKKYEVVITVNDAAITRYEIDQRLKFNAVIGQRGARRAKVEDTLIDDRLRLQAARRLGLAITDEGMERELENFAGRANLTVKQFDQILRSKGVSLQTAKDFIEANVVWREVVRSKFAGQGEVSEAEIDRAIATGGARGGLRVLISEVVLPARPGEKRRAKRLADRITNMRTVGAFASAARKHSASPTRNKSGRLPWMALSELPAPLRPILLALKPGEVSAPLEVENAILLFQLRDIQETKPKKRKTSALEFATILIPEGQTRDILARIDVCDDLYGVAKRMGGQKLERETKKPGQIAKEISLKLANLDQDELSVLPGPTGMNKIVMLCGRSYALNDGADDVDRGAISDQLRQRRLSSLADGYLQELRAKARIVRK